MGSSQYRTLSTLLCNVNVIEPIKYDKPSPFSYIPKFTELKLSMDDFADDIFCHLLLKYTFRNVADYRINM